MGNVLVQHDRAITSLTPVSTRAWLFVPMLVRLVVPPRRPGVYLLGGLDPVDGTFSPFYVGRSDTDVRKRVACHEHSARFTHFRVRLSTSPTEAYNLECHCWHALRDGGRLINQHHPDVPVWAQCHCPYCSASTEFARLVDSSPPRQRHLVRTFSKKAG